ncbi:MAG: hypothetical protein E6I27_04605 [Chloroflexi bacterium]|nr:MAG: hypothetical protein E6I27_04605 [Chloroflexota bacterium]
MRPFWIAAVVLVVAACGQAQGNPSSAVGSPSPTSQTSPSPLLFAVLEAKGTANAWTYNTVAIAGLDGRERASATFAPMPSPALSCIGAVLPPSAHVAAGKVFFADATGVVRSLAVDGTVATAATFPMTSTQQMLSFAVSPDGSKLLGTVYTIPTDPFACNGSASGTFSFDAYSASNGGAAQLVYHQTWTKPQSVLALTGWDSVGPIGTYPTVWASQGGGPGSTLGVKVRVDAATLQPGTAFSEPSKCLVWDSNQNGSFVCTKDGITTNAGTAQQQVAVPVSVRRADGTEAWHFTATGGTSNPELSPDGQSVVMCCSGLSGGELVFNSDGTSTTLGPGFFAYAWLNSRTAIGEVHADPLQQPPLTLGYVSLDDRATVVSLRLTGAFVGTVRG